jgi:ribonucleoside-diphosphate reductase alpha chain
MGGEIGLYPGEPCDLGAVNVSAYFNMGDRVGSGEWHWALERILNDSFLYSEYLDLILDAEKSPLPEIEEAIKSKRRIGLGMMGLGDALIKLGIRYGSAESFSVAHELAKRIRQGAEEYTYDAHPTPTLPGNRRNVALVTVAPTGTTAMVMGTTSGIEPLFAPFIYRRVGTEYKQILHPLFKEMMEQFKPSPYFCSWKEVQDGMYVPDQWDWSKVTSAIVENHGSVQNIIGIPKEVQYVFACAHDIKPLEHVRMQAAVQEAFDYQDDQPTYVGNSISKTINMPSTSTWQDVREVYRRGWTHQLKGITVYVDGSRDLQVLNTSMEDDGSTAKSQAQDEQLQEIIAASCSLDGTCDV